MRLDYSPLHRLLDALAAVKPGLFFIQIGANDGVAFDPLRPCLLRHGWAGILVEPAPAVFQRLRANYAGQPGLVFENVAIAGECGEKILHMVAGQPGVLDQVSSLLPGMTGRFAPVRPDGSAGLDTIPVPCLTFDDLCRRHGVGAVDLLVIDTEGYDFEIIRTIDFTRFRPWVIVYECENLSLADQVRCFTHLGRQGYSLVGLESGIDTLALRSEARARHPELDRIWRELHTAGSRGRRPAEIAGHKAWEKTD